MNVKLNPVPNTGSTGGELALHGHLTGTLLPDCAGKRQSHQLLSSQHWPQLILILLYKLDVSSSEGFSLYQKQPDQHQRWTKLLSLLLLSGGNFHSTKAVRQHASHLLSSIDNADKLFYHFWQHCLRKHLRDSRSATTSHLKAIIQNTLPGQILFHRNRQLSPSCSRDSKPCLRLAFCIFRIYLETQASFTSFPLI